LGAIEKLERGVLNPVSVNARSPKISCGWGFWYGITADRRLIKKLTKGIIASMQRLVLASSYHRIQEREQISEQAHWHTYLSIHRQIIITVTHTSSPTHNLTLHLSKESPSVKRNTLM
jgi:hypothetical protein